MRERRTNPPPPAFEAHPPLPCGEGAGGEGRADAQARDQVCTRPAGAGLSARPSSPDPFSAREKGRAHQDSRAVKVGHGWAPAPGENRQKDRTRTKLRARRLRMEVTPAEQEFWKLLKSIEGHTFRRQPAIGDRVYDFGCYGARLLIEIDGAVHDRPEVQADDKAKTIHAVRNGFRLLR